jgi:M6 family metalloprotease-like protein
MILNTKKIKLKKLIPMIKTKSILPAILFVLFSFNNVCLVAQSGLLTGDLNRVVVLARFNGDPEFDQSRSYYDTYYNGADSSLKSYFKAISNGKLNVNSFLFPTESSTSNSFELKYCFYCYDSDWSKNFPTCKGKDISSLSDVSIGFIIKDLVSKIGTDLDPTINIDKDNDGIVDNFVILLRGSGRGLNQGIYTPQNGVISDRYTNTNGLITLNGKIVKNYTIVYERNSLSTNCRFLLNCLGFQSLYRMQSSFPRPVGAWDPLDGPELSYPLVYNRWKYSAGQWVENIPTIDHAGMYTLNSSDQATNNAYRINSTDPNEFFILEFRDNSKGYDINMPESGLIVYRVNNLQTGSLHDIPEYYVFRTDGTITIPGDLQSAAFSNLNGHINFNATSNPTPFLSTGVSQNISISGIAITGQTLIFNVDNIPTSINTVKTDELNIYPNPTFGLIHINGGYEKLTLFDISGKRLFEKVLTVETPATIDLSDRNAGFYILELKKGQETKKVKIIRY